MPTDESKLDSPLPDGVLAVRFGPGANCSSIGSVVDILFVTATVGGAILTALASLSHPKAARDEAPAPASEPEPEPTSDR